MCAGFSILPDEWILGMSLNQPNHSKIATANVLRSNLELDIYWVFLKIKQVFFFLLKIEYSLT